MNYHLHEAREGVERMMGKTEEVLWDRDRRLVFKADGTPVRIHIQSRFCTLSLVGQCALSL
jgi:hypothetical protein